MKMVKSFLKTGDWIEEAGRGRRPFYCLKSGGNILKANGTLVNYYVHCKRQCYLHGNRLNMEDNSELVK